METPKLESVKRWLDLPKNLYVGGLWQSGQKTFATYNPTDRSVLANLTDASATDVDKAVEAAKSAFLVGDWKTISRKDRATKLQAIGNLIRNHRAELATLESLNNGKTYAEAYNDDLPESADVFDYYAGWIDKYYSETCPVEKGFINFTQREPVGVCALVVPWNFPLLLACWKLAPALAMGNTVVVKPSPFTSLSMIRLAEIIHESGLLPAGVFNVVTGGLECGEALSRHPQVNKISFTGSTFTGKKIVEASGQSNLKSVTLELGGKSPNIIFEDAKDLPSILNRSFTAMFSHKGEKCSEPTRLLVHESLYDKVIEVLAEKANAVVCGDPFDPKTQQGPQCHEAHYQKVMEYIEIGKKEGATLIAGGNADTSGSNAKGFFVRPTIFGNVTQQMRIAREEIFGPVLCVMKFRTEEEAIQIANDTEYGLAAGFYTADASRVHRVAAQLEAGMVFVNHYGCYDFSSPFGGSKQSGWGKEMAIHSLDAYTKLKSVWIKYS